MNSLRSDPNYSVNTQTFNNDQCLPLVGKNNKLGKDGKIVS